MSLTTHSVRIAGKTYDLTIELGTNGAWICTVKQYPGIVSSAYTEGEAFDNVIKAIVDKIGENNPSKTQNA